MRPLTAAARGNFPYSIGASSHKQLKVAGSAVLPLTLRAETDAIDGVIKLAADIPALDDCAASLWLRIAMSRVLSTL